ncbi:unnamed protein product [Notodromas monacha]|uniref:Uncharacterized protein n=1 Tax=Notodromas monacha TaxID=399045 RepID=A0A7R9BDL6_9CRUS|nr:unnamed protein product [Notodromas monacha]CAG0912698.1 unnamed protein product [Notodromas monacha]
MWKRIREFVNSSPPDASVSDGSDNPVGILYDRIATPSCIEGFSSSTPSSYFHAPLQPNSLKAVSSWKARTSSNHASRNVATPYAVRKRHVLNPSRGEPSSHVRDGMNTSRPGGILSLDSFNESDSRPMDRLSETDGLHTRYEDKKEVENRLVEILIERSKLAKKRALLRENSDYSSKKLPKRMRKDSSSGSDRSEDSDAPPVTMPSPMKSARTSPSTSSRPLANGSPSRFSERCGVPAKNGQKSQLQIPVENLGSASLQSLACMPVAVSASVSPISPPSRSKIVSNHLLTNTSTAPLPSRSVQDGIGGEYRSSHAITLASTSKPSRISMEKPESEKIEELRQSAGAIEGKQKTNLRKVSVWEESPTGKSFSLLPHRGVMKVPEELRYYHSPLPEDELPEKNAEPTKQKISPLVPGGRLGPIPVSHDRRSATPKGIMSNYVLQRALASARKSGISSQLHRASLLTPHSFGVDKAAKMLTPPRSLFPTTVSESQGPEIFVPVSTPTSVETPFSISVTSGVSPIASVNLPMPTIKPAQVMVSGSSNSALMSSVVSQPSTASPLLPPEPVAVADAEKLPAISVGQATETVAKTEADKNPMKSASCLSALVGFKLPTSSAAGSETSKPASAVPTNAAPELPAAVQTFATATPVVAASEVKPFSAGFSLPPAFGAPGKPPISTSSIPAVTTTPSSTSWMVPPPVPPASSTLEAPKFNFGTSVTSPPLTTTQTTSVVLPPTFSFGKTAAPFTFGAKAVVSEAKPEEVATSKPFTFGSSAAPTFNFGSSATGLTSAAPSSSIQPFKFGSSSTKRDLEQTGAASITSAFSFGSAASTTAKPATTTEPAQSAFTFGSSGSTGSAAPSFSFGTGTDPSKNLFSFKAGTNAAKPTEAVAPFTFGGSSKPAEMGSTGGFTFGSTSSAAPAAAPVGSPPAFSFGGSASATNASGSSGFGFGQALTTTSPGFPFGSNAAPAPKPFGQQNAGGFSFDSSGSATNPPAAGVSSPASGFAFGLGSTPATAGAPTQQSGGFQFGASSTQSFPFEAGMSASGPAFNPGFPAQAPPGGGPLFSVGAAPNRPKITARRRARR